MMMSANTINRLWVYAAKIALETTCNKKTTPLSSVTRGFNQKAYAICMPLPCSPSLLFELIHIRYPQNFSVYGEISGPTYFTFYNGYVMAKSPLTCFQILKSTMNS